MVKVPMKYHNSMTFDSSNQLLGLVYFFHSLDSIIQQNEE